MALAGAILDPELQKGLRRCSPRGVPAVMLILGKIKPGVQGCVATVLHSSTLLTVHTITHGLCVRGCALSWLYGCTPPFVSLYYTNSSRCQKAERRQKAERSFVLCACVF
jgi:hypothetical protein